MQTIKSILSLLLGLTSFGIILVSAQSGGAQAVSTSNTPEPLLADGLPVEIQPAAEPAQPAAVAATGPVYYRTIAGSEFRPSHSDLTFAPAGAAMYALTIPSSQSFKRPLELPNGAQVTKISMFAIDNDPVNNMTLQLTRNNPAVSVGQTFVSTFSTTNAVTGPSIQTISVDGSVTPIITVDNSTFNYALRYQPTIVGDFHVLVGVRIEFTLPTGFLPLVSR